MRLKGADAPPPAAHHAPPITAFPLLDIRQGARGGGPPILLPPPSGNSQCWCWPSTTLARRRRSPLSVKCSACLDARRASVSASVASSPQRQQSQTQQETHLGIIAAV